MLAAGAAVTVIVRQQLRCSWKFVFVCVRLFVFVPVAVAVVVVVAVRPTSLPLFHPTPSVYTVKCVFFPCPTSAKQKPNRTNWFSYYFNIHIFSYNIQIPFPLRRSFAFEWVWKLVVKKKKNNRMNFKKQHVFIFIYILRNLKTRMFIVLYCLFSFSGKYTQTTRKPRGERRTKR